MPKKTSTVDKALSFGVIVSSRLFFNAAHAIGARSAVLAALSAQGHKAVIGDPALTSDGAVASLEDAKKYAALFEKARDRIDGIIVVLANFGDEIGVVETIRRAALGVPSSCRHVPTPSQSSASRVAGTLLRQDLRLQQSLSIRHPLDRHREPHRRSASEEFARDLDFFARVCRTVKGLKTARVGAIGVRPGAFQTVRYSEKLLQRSGITVVPVDLSEIFAEAESLGDEDPAVMAKVKSILGYGRVPSSIPPAKVIRQAKFSVVTERWLEANECDASAVQCWNSIEKNYGCASCLTMSMSGEALRPSACEVDVTGAVSMYALSLASGEQPPSSTGTTTTTAVRPRRRYPLLQLP